MNRLFAITLGICTGLGVLAVLFNLAGMLIVSPAGLGIGLGLGLCYLLLILGLLMWSPMWPKGSYLWALLALLWGTPHESSPGCLPRDSVLRARGPELLLPQAHPPETSPVRCCHSVGTLRGSSYPWTQPPGWTPASPAPPHGPPDSQPRPLLAGGTSLFLEKDGCEPLAPTGGALSVCLAPCSWACSPRGRCSPGAGAHARGEEWHAGTELQG